MVFGRDAGCHDYIIQQELPNIVAVVSSLRKHAPLQSKETPSARAAGLGRKGL